MSLIVQKSATAAAARMDPWLRARERYLEDLTDKERVLFSEASLENLFYSASATHKLHQASSRSAALSKKIQPLVQSLEQYGRALDMYSIASPTTMCPLWGSIRVVLHVAANYGKYLEKLVDMFARIGDVLPRFRAYEKLFSDHSRLLHMLSVAYVDIITFCMDARKAFSKGKKRWAIGSFGDIWKPFDQRFAEVLDQFRLHKENVEKEASLSHMMEAAEARALEQENRNNELRRRLLAQLSSIDQDYKQRKLRKVRHENTCMWLATGCGKTTLTTMVVDHLTTVAATGDFVIAHYYCDYSEPDTLTAVAILGCLIKQLLEKIDISDDIAKQIDRCYKCGTGKPTTEELITLLLAVLRLFPELYVVIDGIDECESQEREDVFSIIRQLADFGGCVVKAFISSREEVDIKKAFARYRQIHVSEANVMSDIDSYVKGAVEVRVQTGKLVVRDHSLVGTVIDALSHGARGMFLWVFFQLNELCEANSDGEIRDILRNLPKDLAETYTRLLRRIVKSKRGSGKMLTARKIFQWICCAKRPLMMEELKEAIAFEPTDLSWDAEKIPVESSRLIQACGNLVVFDEDDQTVRMVHYTVQQFLTSAPMEVSVAGFHFQLPQAKIYTGEICVAYLSFTDFEAQMVRESPSYPVRDMQVLESAFWKGTTYLRGINKVIWNSWNAVSGTATNENPPTIDFGRVMKRLEQPLQTLHQKYQFLNYAIENWLGHTISFSPLNTKMWHSFKTLALEKGMLFNYKAWDESLASRDMPYLPLFLWAVGAGHVPLLKLLLEPPIGPELGSYVRHQSKFAQSPLNTASRHGHVEVLKLLLAKNAGATLDSRSLRFAAESGCTEAVEALLMNGVRDDIAGDSLTALDVAVASGCEAMVGVLLRYGSQDSSAALRVAVVKRNEYMVKILLEYGADPDTLLVEFPYRPLLVEAAANGYEPIARVLLEKGADVMLADAKGHTALWGAILGGHETVVQLRADWKVEHKMKKGVGIMDKDPDDRTALHWTTFKGYEDVVRLLLEKGADVNAVDSSRQILLHWAALCGYSAVVRLLLGNGADIEAKDNAGLTALHWAAYEGHIETVRLLVSGGAIIDSPVAGDPAGGTALQRAVMGGHNDVVQLLAENGANLDATGSDGITALHRAVRAGHEKIFQTLMTKGADAEAKDIYGRTALHWAAMEGHRDIIQLLVEKGVDTSESGSGGRTVPNGAAGGGQDKVTPPLIKGVDVKVRDGRGITALHWSAVGGNVDIVRLLAENGADLNSANSNGMTALHDAARVGHSKVVQILTAKGADIKAKCAYGRTALHRAAMEGHGDIVQLLVEKGADIAERGPGGMTALHEAARAGHSKVVQILSAKGTDVETKCAFGRTALYWAVRGWRADVVRLLVEKGADTNARGLDGRTALYLAARGENDEVFRLLATNDADVEAGDLYGRTALHWAAIEKHEVAIQLLLKHGANPETKDKFGRTALYWIEAGRRAVPAHAAATKHKALAKQLNRASADQLARQLRRSGFA